MRPRLACRHALHREGVEAVEGAFDKAAHGAALGSIRIDPIEVFEVGAVLGLADEGKRVVVRCAAGQCWLGLRGRGDGNGRRIGLRCCAPGRGAEAEEGCEQNDGDVGTRKHQAFPSSHELHHTAGEAGPIGAHPLKTANRLQRRKIRAEARVNLLSFGGSASAT